MYLSGAFGLVLATGSVRVFTAWYLQGKVGFSHCFVGHSIIELIWHWGCLACDTTDFLYRIVFTLSRHLVAIGQFYNLTSGH